MRERLNEAHGFRFGQEVRFRPGKGAYGYEDSLGPDGKAPGVVLGFSRARVRVRIKMRFGHRVACVYPDSLTSIETTSAPDDRGDAA